MTRNKSQLVRGLALIAIVGTILCGLLYAVQVLPDFLRRRETPSKDQWTLPAQQQTDIRIDLEAVDIDIRRYEGEDIEISFEGFRASTGQQEGAALVALQKGNTLEITENDPTRGKINLGPWGFDGARGTLTVLLPRQGYGQVTIHTFSGGVSIEGLAAGKLAVSTSSGRLSATDLEVDATLRLETFSGDLNLRNLGAEACTLISSSGKVVLADGAFDTLTAETFSGTVEVSSLEARQKATLKTSDGAVQASGLQAGSLRCETFSGDITLAEAETASLSVETSSGRVEIHLTETPENTAIDTFSGAVTLGLPADAAFTCATDTFSGHVIIGFPSVPETQEGGGNAHVVGDGTHAIRIGTSSGNITIQPE